MQCNRSKYSKWFLLNFHWLLNRVFLFQINVKSTLCLNSLFFPIFAGRSDILSCLTFHLSLDSQAILVIKNKHNHKNKGRSGKLMLARGICSIMFLILFKKNKKNWKKYNGNYDAVTIYCYVIVSYGEVVTWLHYMSNFMS